MSQERNSRDHRDLENPDGECAVLLSRHIARTAGGAFMDWIEREYESARAQNDPARQERLKPLYVATLMMPNIKTDELEGEDALIYEEWLALPGREPFGRPFEVIVVEILPPEEFAMRHATGVPCPVSDDEIFGFGEEAVRRAREICEASGQSMWSDLRPKRS